MKKYFKNEISEKRKRISLLEKDISRIKSDIEKITGSKAYRYWMLIKGSNKYKKLIKNPKILIKAFKVLMAEGPSGLLSKKEIFEEKLKKTETLTNQYQLWLKKNNPSKKDIKKQEKRSRKFSYRPKISIVTPVYNPDEKWLRSCINSVLNQTYDNWELCLADDASPKPHVKRVLNEYAKKDKRIKVAYRKKNGHISAASNSALKLTTGEFVGLLDHDDDLAPHALFKVVELLNKNKKADFIYSDEDKLELDGTRVDPFFKPDWSPDLLLSTNYICHFSVIRKKLIDEVGGFRKGYEGSQDYDLFLRVTEKTKQIFHISDILYSWRKVPGSTAAVYSTKDYCNQASINSLSDALKRRKIKGIVENGITLGSFRINYKIKGNPLVSIIIPTKDKVDFLIKCVNSVLEKTKYKNFEIIITDTGSEEKETHQFYDEIKKNKKVRIINWSGKKFNYSAVNNFAVDKSKGEFLLLLNNDTEVISPDWIESMLGHAQQKNVGAVGAKLLYPDGKIQHAGVILGIMGVANHASLLIGDDTIQGFPVPNSKDMTRNFSAVTAACLMIEKKKYNQVKQLDEKFRIAFNDVDFCLKLMKNGYRNIYTPYARLYHYESISVGKPSEGTRDVEELNKEADRMKRKWPKLINEDPFYNKNLSLKNEKFDLKT